ncbi:MAG: transposase, partial [Acidobacteria bacterium]
MKTGLETRWPASRRRGREGTSAEVVLRMLVLKHLYGLSYADRERQVRANLVYRAFARIGCERVPDEQTILTIAKALGPEVIAALHQRVVGLAVSAGVATGRRMRIDTTVVET